MAEEFKKGERVRLTEPVMTVDATDANNSSCILHDGTKIIVPTKLLSRLGGMRVLEIDPDPELDKEMG